MTQIDEFVCLSRYQPEQRIVVTETKADTVVLRLRNMLVSLQLLKETGLAVSEFHRV